MAHLTGVQARHQRDLDAGRFWIQRCGSCDRAFYFPRELCPHCGSIEWSEQTPSGLGTVHATTVVRRKPTEGGDHVVCLVDLDEGPRLMSRVIGLAPDTVAIGLRVRARVLVQDGRGLLVFEAAA